MVPERDDQLNVSGIEIFNASALATLKETCAFYNLVPADSTERCFEPLWEFQKRFELQTTLAASKPEAPLQREPRPQRLPDTPEAHADSCVF